MPVGVCRAQPNGIRFDTGNWLSAAEYVYCNNYPLELSSFSKCFFRDRA